MRTVLLILLSLTLVPLLLATILLGTANLMLTESFVLETIEEIGLFRVLDEMVSDLVAEDLATEANQLIEPFLPHLEFAVIIEDVGKNLVAKTFAYLEGDSDSIVLIFDFRPLMTQIEDMVMDREAFISLIASQDQDTADMLGKLPAEELLDIQKQMRDDLLAEDNLPTELELDMLEMIPELEQLRSFFAVKNKLVIGAIVAALVLMTLMLSIRLAAGLAASGATLVAAGAALLISINTIEGWYGRWSLAAEGELPAESVNMLAGLLGRLLPLPRDIAAACCFVGAVAIILALTTIWEKKVKRAEAARITAW